MEKRRLLTGFFQVFIGVFLELGVFRANPDMYGSSLVWPGAADTAHVAVGLPLSLVNILVGEHVVNVLPWAIKILRYTVKSSKYNFVN